MSKRKILSIVVASFLSTMSASAFAAEQVRVAVSSTSLFFASTYVAKQMGYFDAAGLDVTIVDVGSGSNVIASVVGGSAEMGNAGIKNISQGIEKGQSLKAFGSSLKGFPNFLVVRDGFMEENGVKQNSPLKDRIASIKGKSIAVNDIGGSAGDFVRELLRRGGLGERDATLINISSTPGRLSALKTKRVDALVGYAPEPETAMIEGFGSILIDSASDIPEVKSIAYIMHFSQQRFLQEKPAVAEAFIRAVARAVKLMKDDTATARDAFFAQMEAKSFGTKTDKKLAELQWQNMRPYFPTVMATTPAEIAGARKFFHIPDAQTDDALIDNSIAARVDASK
jgi:ABC-type nitrate/sulfonate/bicarbonate transport system substrate-binding protein